MKYKHNDSRAERSKNFWGKIASKGLKNVKLNKKTEIRGGGSHGIVKILIPKILIPKTHIPKIHIPKIHIPTIHIRKFIFRKFISRKTIMHDGKNCEKTYVYSSFFPVTIITLSFFIWNLILLLVLLSCRYQKGRPMFPSTFSLSFRSTSIYQKSERSLRAD